MELKHHASMESEGKGDGQWRRPGAEFGGTEKFLVDQDLTFLKFALCTANISDDLFFVSDQVFRIFPFFSQNFRIYLLLCSMSYMTISSQEQPLFQKKFLYDILFYSVGTFARIRQHCFSKYWGNGCMGR